MIELPDIDWTIPEGFHNMMLQTDLRGDWKTRTLVCRHKMREMRQWRLQPPDRIHFGSSITARKAVYWGRTAPFTALAVTEASIFRRVWAAPWRRWWLGARLMLLMVSEGLPLWNVVGRREDGICHIIHVCIVSGSIQVWPSSIPSQNMPKIEMLHCTHLHTYHITWIVYILFILIWPWSIWSRSAEGKLVVKSPFGLECALIAWIPVVVPSGSLKCLAIVDLVRPIGGFLQCGYPKTDGF